MEEERLCGIISDLLETVDHEYLHKLQTYEEFVDALVAELAFFGHQDSPMLRRTLELSITARNQWAEAVGRQRVSATDERTIRDGSCDNGSLAESLTRYPAIHLRPDSTPPP